MPDLYAPQTFAPGTRFVIIGKKHPVFTRPFEITDVYLRGEAFYKEILTNPEEHFGPAKQTTLKALRAAMADGYITTQEEAAKDATPGLGLEPISDETPVSEGATVSLDDADPKT